MKTSVIGYPRVGSLRELKFASEKYFRGEISAADLQETAKTLRAAHIAAQRKNGVDFIPCNDFSFYDPVLDAAVLLGAVLHAIKCSGSPLSTPISQWRAATRAKTATSKALAMKKWFNTNYHYMVPELDDDTAIALHAEKPLAELAEAKAAGVQTKPVVCGAFTFLKLARCTGEKTAADFARQTAAAYGELLGKARRRGRRMGTVRRTRTSCATLPQRTKSSSLRCMKRSLRRKAARKCLYRPISATCATAIRSLRAPPRRHRAGLPRRARELCARRKIRFPCRQSPLRGACQRQKYLEKQLRSHRRRRAETAKDGRRGRALYLLFAAARALHAAQRDETLRRIHGAVRLCGGKTRRAVRTERDPRGSGTRKMRRLSENAALFATRAWRQKRRRAGKGRGNQRERLYPPARLRDARNDPERAFCPSPFAHDDDRLFPQTADVKANRAAFKKGEITKAEYDAFNRKKIAECVALQEKIGLDVLVHGEYERNDMVEYFGECLSGFLFTEKAWVQSYGTPLRKAAHRLGRRLPRKADDRRMVGLCAEPHGKADEGHADGPRHHPQLVLPRARTSRCANARCRSRWRSAKRCSTSRQTG